MIIPKQPIVKIIRDPVHDYIRINKTERRIIDSYAFQRLRYIHQNGTAYLTYPSAHATRFEHSLGTMHLAGLMVEKALQNSDSKKVRKFLRACKEALGLQGSSTEKFAAKIYQLIRLAGLLHDIGHLPFSHTFESLFEHEIENIYQRELVELWKEHLKKQGKHRLQLHEFITLQIIQNDKQIKEALGDSDLDAICKILHPPSDAHHVFDTLHDVISSDVDADRCDYLLRDGQLSGADFGHFDIGRLIDSMLLGKREKSSTYYIRPSIKAQSAVEGLLAERYKLYKWVYRHHRVFATDTALEKIFSILLLQAKEKKGFLKDLLIWPNCFYKGYTPQNLSQPDHPTYFDDIHVLEMLTKIYQRLRNRKLNKPQIKDFQVLQVLLEELLFRKKRILPLWKMEKEYQGYNSYLLHEVRKIYDDQLQIQHYKETGEGMKVHDDDRPLLLKGDYEMPLNWLVKDYDLHQFKNKKELEDIYNEKVSQEEIPVQIMIGTKKFPSEKEYHFVGKDLILHSFSDTPFIKKLQEADRCSVYMHVFLIPLKEMTSKEQDRWRDRAKELFLEVIKKFIQKQGVKRVTKETD
jgi:HD superfamily phosphohydrolase